MTNFKTRYQAYLKAEQKASKWAMVLSWCVMAVIILPCCIFFDRYQSFLRSLVFFVVMGFVACFLGAVSDAFMKRRFIRLFFSKEMRKNGSENSSVKISNPKFYNMENITIIQKSSGLFEHYFVETFFRHYADFSGKASRKQFWMGYLFYILIMMPLYALDMLIGIPVLSSIYILAMLIPYIALVVRRLHDIGKSGWWYFIALVPLIGVIWLLVLLCKKGETKNAPVKGVATDWIILAFIVIISVVGFVLGLKNFSEKMTENMIGAVEAADTSDTSAAMTDFPIDENTMSGGDTTGDSSGLEHASYLGSSSSGQYDYYLKNGDLNIYQKDTNTGSLYTINMEQLSDEVIVSSISDYTTVGSKIIFITNNGAAGMTNADTALAYDMDSESWTYITTAKSIRFDSTKNFLLTSSPTDATMEHFEESEIDLSNLL